MSPFEPAAALAKRYQLANTSLAIAGQTYELLRPHNLEDLISEEDFAVDGRIPYWADCWPSAKVLAARIVELPGRGQSLLELGCGIGLVSLAAARAGFEVLATDYYGDALRFTAANAARHGLPNVETRLVDWRRLPADLGEFHVVAASDVLYEAPQAALVATVLARTLAADGVALISDPGRRTASALIEECGQCGLRVECVDRVPTEDFDAEITVSVFEVRRV